MIARIIIWILLLAVFVDTQCLRRVVYVAVIDRYFIDTAIGYGVDIAFGKSESIHVNTGKVRPCIRRIFFTSRLVRTDQEVEVVLVESD